MMLTANQQGWLNEMAAGMDPRGVGARAIRAAIAEIELLRQQHEVRTQLLTDVRPYLCSLEERIGHPCPLKEGTRALRVLIDAELKLPGTEASS
jgi:hypothetical protein